MATGSWVSYGPDIDYETLLKRYCLNGSSLQCAMRQYQPPDQRNHEEPAQYQNNGRSRGAVDENR